MARFLRNLFYRVSLGNPAYRFLFQPGPPDEVVVIDCETTGLNPRRRRDDRSGCYQGPGPPDPHQRAHSGVVIRADKPPTAESIKVHHLRAQEVALGAQMHKVLPELLHFIGGRPIVGYYVDFDITMLDKYVLPYIQTKLPNPRIDVSAIYYALKYRNAPPGTVHDLRFASILVRLGAPSFAPARRLQRRVDDGNDVCAATRYAGARRPDQPLRGTSSSTFLSALRFSRFRYVSRPFTTYCVCLELRSLPSTGVTRLRGTTDLSATPGRPACPSKASG